MAKGDKQDCNDAGDESRYGDELLRAHWNPAISLLQSSCDRTPDSIRPARGDVSDEEAAAFLDRVYAHCF
ncbi:MAG: hypothetical protein JWO70_3556 [Betaproteobacteria bacterium]|jgi:hypothetical protein|nr:hypothetical protein [Betaproteobacteria bacterium]